MLTYHEALNEVQILNEKLTAALRAEAYWRLRCAEAESVVAERKETETC